LALPTVPGLTGGRLGAVRFGAVRLGAVSCV